MSGGVALFDYDNDGLPDLYFVDSLTVDTASDPKAARSALYRNLGNGTLRGRDRQGRASATRAGAWACARRTWTATAGKISTSPRSAAIISIETTTTARSPTSPSSAGVARRRLVGRLRLRRLRSRRPARSVRQPLREDRPRAPARVRQGQDLRVPRHRRCSAARAACRAKRTSSSTTTATDASPTSRRRPASRIRAATSASAIAWFDYNDDGWPDLYVANDSTPNFLYVNQKDGTFKEQAFPLGVAVSEDGAEQGSMGVALGDYDHSGRFSLFVTNFSEEYNDALSQRRRPLQRRLVPIADRAVEPAVRRLGRRVPRLRQRRVARHHRRQRARLPAARSAASSARPPATASASCCTTTAATARSTRSRRATDRR